MSKVWLDLDKRFDEVFTYHIEDYIHGMVFFEGVLREKYEDATKPIIKRFITGGASVATWHIEREGPYIKCRFKYNKPAEFNTFSDISDDKDLIESMVKLLKKGAESRVVQDKYWVTYDAINTIRRQYGGQI